MEGFGSSSMIVPITRKWLPLSPAVTDDSIPTDGLDGIREVAGNMLKAP
jgi:hypothetical protein